MCKIALWTVNLKAISSFCQLKKFFFLSFRAMSQEMAN